VEPKEPVPPVMVTTESLILRFANLKTFFLGIPR
jgi:hypothetical protein